MQRTIEFKLELNSNQAAIFDRTLSESSACFDTVAEAGWNSEPRCKNGVELHRLTYYSLREQFPDLPSQLVVSARMKATEALASALKMEKKGLAVTCPRRKRASVRYDARSMSVSLDKNEVSLATVAGRQKIGIRRHVQADRWLKCATGVDTAEMVHRPSGYWLKLVLTVPSPPKANLEQSSDGLTIPMPVQDTQSPSGALGVDLGLNRPVVTSDGVFLGDRRWKEIEKRNFRLKRSLQAKGTKSAKRHLKVMRHRQARFRLDCDRVLAKAVVSRMAPGQVLVLENLTGIRGRTKQKGRVQRRRHHAWSYAQFRQVVEHKAEEFGITVVAIDPRKTSQRCSRCGHIHRLNRVSQSEFKCRSCGFELNADLNAARNIRDKFVLEWSEAETKSPVAKPPAAGCKSLACQAVTRAPQGYEDGLARETVNQPYVASA